MSPQVQTKKTKTKIQTEAPFTENAAPVVVTPEMTAQKAMVLSSFRVKNEITAKQIEDALADLCELVLEDQPAIDTSTLNMIGDMIHQLDEKLTAQMDKILHAPEFQKMESAWRGLNHLVMHSETDAQLKIGVMNASKRELSESLRMYPGASWDQSPLFKIIYQNEYNMLGGQPFGCLVGDFEFSHHPQDVQLLRNLGRIAAAAHAPFYASASPELMNMDSWSELSKPRDISKLFDSDAYAAWRSLRESEDACYIGLCLPRVLSRLPYGDKYDPISGFDYQEDIEGATGNKFSWMNAVYPMAVNINRAFSYYGWTARIRGPESGGLVEHLPAVTYLTDDGEVELKCPTEIAISESRGVELDKAGLIAITHEKHSDRAVFMSAQSLSKPTSYINNKDATAASHLRTRLPYVMVASRFAHYLKAMVRQKIGSTMNRTQLNTWLENWIMDYVHGAPDMASESEKAMRPLAQARVELVDDEENPGQYRARFYLVPHYQLEAMRVELCLVARLPKPKG